MKRFYNLVSTEKTLGGYAILLDGKSVKTPARAPLLASTKNLAEAIMAEWAAQKDMIDPETMPLTQILSTKIDRVSAERAALSAQVIKYLNGDLICYRTDQPPELAELQAQSWDPWLDWFEERFNHRLETTITLKALEHPEELHFTILRSVTAMNDDVFAVFQLVAPLSGSLVLALAFTQKALTADAVFAAARVEETYKARLYNEEKYGPDPAQEVKDLAVKRDLDAAQRYLELLD